MTFDQEPLQSAQPPRDFARELAQATTVRRAEAIINRWLPRKRVPTARTSQGAGPDVIGIWRRAVVEGEEVFVRDNTIDDDLFWADVEVIGPKRGKRVILLGESVARGSFVDPQFNCASVLRTYLGGVCGSGDVEVVDLARSGIDYEGLLRMLIASAALKPDAFVILAGNNWVMSAAALNSSAMAVALRRSHNWAALRPLFQNAMRAQVASWMYGLAEAGRAQNTPIVFGIPAGNVRDFRWPSEWRDPLLGSDEMARWDDQISKAEALLRSKEYEGARAIARDIAKADPFRARAAQICGLSALALGDRDEAARYFDALDDIRLYLPLGGGLRCRTTMATAIREASKNEGMRVVDLPAVFVAANEGIPPGRELFFDHVHMTPSGIRLAMAAIGEELLPVLGKPRIPSSELLRIATPVDPSTMAQGHLVAALVHAGLEHDEVVEHHAAETVRYDPDIAPVMRDAVRIMLCRSARTYYEAYHSIAKASERLPGLRYILYRMPAVSAQRVFVELAVSIAAAADAVIPGTTAECAQLLGESAIAATGTTSLTEYLLRPSWGGEDRLRRDVLGERNRSFVRAYSRRTLFQLRCGTPRDLQFEITARHGKGNHRGKRASLLVNDVSVYEWEIDASWGSWSFTVPYHTLQEGMNDLCIVWPDPHLSRSDREEELLEIFEAGLPEGAGFMAEWYPAFGDIQRLDVSYADGAPAFRDRRDSACATSRSI